jgi:hypothetical protein
MSCEVDVLPLYNNPKSLVKLRQSSCELDSWRLGVAEARRHQCSFLEDVRSIVKLSSHAQYIIDYAEAVEMHLCAMVILST